jgi:hypothetical protein
MQEVQKRRISAPIWAKYLSTWALQDMGPERQSMRLPELNPFQLMLVKLENARDEGKADIPDILMKELYLLFECGEAYLIAWSANRQVCWHDFKAKWEKNQWER